jgi:hypothetical protein
VAEDPQIKSILYVDDDRSLRNLLSGILKEILNVKVQDAKDFPEFLKKIGIELKERADANDLIEKLMDLETIPKTAQFLKEHDGNEFNITHNNSHDFDFYLVDNALTRCAPDKGEGPHLIKIIRALHDYLRESKKEVKVPNPTAVLFSGSDIKDIFPKEGIEGMKKFRISGCIPKSVAASELHKQIVEIHRARSGVR